MLTQHQKAIHILENPEKYPGLKERNTFKRKLLVWRFPSFDPYSSWSLFLDEDEYWVRRIEWNRVQALQGGDLDTYGSEVLILQEQGEQILRELAELSLKPFRYPEFGGLDGTIYGIEIGNLYQATRLHWWSRAPKEWDCLIEWYQETVNVFDAALPRSTSRNDQ